MTDLSVKFDIKLPENILDTSSTVQDGWNGRLGKVDFVNPQSFVEPRFKVASPKQHVGYAPILNVAYQLDLEYKSLFETHANVDPELLTAGTQAAIDARKDEVSKAAKAIIDAMKGMPNVKDHLLRVIATFRLYSTLKAAGWKYAVRASDLTEFVPTKVLQAVATNVYLHLDENAETDAHIANMVSVMRLAMVSNAIHRDLTNKHHNWITAAAKSPGDVAARALGAGGAMRETLASFMEKCGHDWNHHLTDESLKDAADILTGVKPAKFVDSLVYLGEDVKDKAYTAIFPVEQASKDRWPVGAQGKAAVITGASMATTMISAIANKVKLMGADDLSRNFMSLANAMKSSDPNRETLVKMNSSMEYALSLVYGFCEENDLIEEGTMKAFFNHAKRAPHALATGKALASQVNMAAVNPEALESALTSVFALMQSGLTSSSELLGKTSIPVDIKSIDKFEAAVATDTTMANILEIAKAFSGK